MSSSFPLPQPFTEQARLTLYARADVPATALTYALTARDAQGRYAGYACGVFMASASYAMYSAPLGYFSPAATSASLELRANVSGAQGGRSVWVDEIRLEPQPYTK